MRVVVQARQRLVREGVGMVLSEEPDIEVVDVVADASVLTAVCEAERPDAVILELNATAWDGCRLAAALRKRQRSIVVVALGSADRALAERAYRAGICATIGNDEPVVRILRSLRVGMSKPALRALPLPPIAVRPNAEAVDGALTARQLEVLRLIGAGLTTREVGAELGISAKTVENHKRGLFRRLGVQNQAHAVAVAMRRGLIGSGVGLERGIVS